MAEQLHLPGKEFSLFREIAVSFDPIRDMAALIMVFRATWIRYRTRCH
jgi:hypothetical protein